MAWNGFPAVQGTDWSAISFFKQKWEAYNERRNVLGLSTIYVPAVSCDVQYMGNDGVAVAPTSTTDKFSVQWLQTQIESFCTSFVATIDSACNPVTDYDGETAIEMWDWTKLKARVSGLPAGGWTRKYPGGSGNGRARTGDYFGPHLWNELKAVLDELVWIKKTFAWSNNGGSIVINDSMGDADSDWGTAKQNTIDDWIETTNTTAGAVSVYSDMTQNMGAYEGFLHRRQAWGYLSGMYALLNRDVDWYAFIENISTFDAQGDGVIEDRFELGMTDAGKTGATLTSTDKFLTARFATAPPNWVASGTTGLIGYGAGADAADRVAVIKWDVVGGFTYQ